MRKVSFQDFLLMPSGTIYSVYEPNFEEGLYRKGKTITGFKGEPIDFMCTSLLPWCNNDDTIELGVVSRDGLYGYGGRAFIVYEPDDTKRLITLLQGGPDEAD